MPLLGIHKDLVEQEGIDPKSDEYYTELDKRMGEEFPHKFANGAQEQKSRPKCCFCITLHKCNWTQ